MFFIGIFGYNQKNEKIKTIEFKCTGCIKEELEVIEVYNVFEFFFIPIYKLKKRYFISCSCCNSLFLIKDDNVQSIIMSGKASYDDILEVVNQGNSCHNCGKSLDKSFTYCPKCGEKV